MNATIWQQYFLWWPSCLNVTKYIDIRDRTLPLARNFEEVVFYFLARNLENEEQESRRQKVKDLPLIRTISQQAGIWDPKLGLSFIWFSLRNKVPVVFLHGYSGFCVSRLSLSLLLLFSAKLLVEKAGCFASVNRSAGKTVSEVTCNYGFT